MEIALLGTFPSILVFLSSVSNAHPFQQLHLSVLRSYRAVLGDRPGADLCMLFLGDTWLMFLFLFSFDRVLFPMYKK